jgi:hypothetical protein
MLTELGHYSVFQRPKYTTWQEHLFFWGTLVTMAAICRGMVAQLAVCGAQPAVPADGPRSARPAAEPRRSAYWLPCEGW